MQVINSDEGAESTADKIVNMYNDDEVSNFDFDIKLFEDYELIKDSICCTLINKEMNYDLLGNVPHRDILDLSVVYKYAFKQDNNNCTVLITNNLMKNLGVTEEELYNNSTSGNSVLFKHDVEGLDNLLMKMLEEDKISEDSLTFKGLVSELDRVNPKLIVASNYPKFYGSNVLLDKKCLAEIRDRFDHDLIVIPSSVHEILICTDGDTNEKVLESYKEMVKSVNDSELQVEEILSYSVYVLKQGGELELH